MFPLVVLGLLVLWLWPDPAVSRAAIGSIPEEDVYPSPGDVVTVGILEGGVSRESIVELFATRGYWIAPTEPEGRDLRGFRTAKFVVMNSAANIGMPRRLGQGIFIV